MKRKNKSHLTKPKQHRIYTRKDLKIRPVTRNDKWCIFTRYPNPNAPYGYIVSIPNYSKNMELDLKGTIVRTKLIRKVWHLQFLETARNKFIFLQNKLGHIMEKKKRKILILLQCVVLKTKEKCQKRIAMLFLFWYLLILKLYLKPFIIILLWKS